MAASNRHRKLFEVCRIQCDPQFNPTGLCSLDCIPFCPSFCQPTQFSPTPSPTTSPYASVPPPDHHHQPLSLPLKISLVFLVATFTYTLYKFYSVWYRSRPQRTPPPPPFPENLEPDVVDHPIWYIRTTGLQLAVINNLTVVKFSKTDGTVVEGTDCSVCLTEFEEDDTLRLLPNCKHAFHVSCIDTWLRSHTNCPLCRAVIVNNAVDSPSLERNGGDLVVVGETDLGVSSTDGDRGEASGSSGLRIGEIDEDDRNSNLVKREG